MSKSARSWSTWEKRGRHTWSSRYWRRYRRNGRGGISLGGRAVNRTVGPRVCSCYRGRRGIVSTHQCLVCLKLGTKLILRQHTVLILGFFWWWLSDRPRIESKFNLLPALVICNVRNRDSFHTEDFDFVTVSSGKRVLNPRKAE